MKPLQQITAFSKSQRELLEQQFGIHSAEAFFENATRNAQGVQAALGLTASDFDYLVREVEGYLTPEFVKRCRQPVAKHRRGVIVD